MYYRHPWLYGSLFLNRRIAKDFVTFGLIWGALREGKADALLAAFI